MLNKRIIGTEVLRHFAKRGKIMMQITNAIKMTVMDIHKQYLQADKKLRNYAKSGEEKQSNWLNSLAEIRQEEENKKGKININNPKEKRYPKILTSTELKKLKMEEELQNSHKRIKFAIKGTSTDGVTMVILSEIDGSSQECTTQNAITDALIKAHTQKYQGAWDNPPFNTQSRI